MAKRPVSVPLEQYCEKVSPDYTADEPTPPEGYVYYTDSHQVVSIDRLKNSLLNEKRKKFIKSRAIDIFTAVSEKPEITLQLADDYFTQQLGYKATADGDLSVFQGVGNLTNNESSAIVLLSAKSIDQFVGIFWSNLTIFDEADMGDLADAAIDSVAIGFLAMAFYEHLLSDVGDDERAYKRHVRAARRLMEGLIGSDEMTYAAEYDETRRLFAGVAFRTMVSRLEELGFGGHPGLDRVIAHRASLCLGALRATQDEFFVSLASAKGEDEADAYIRAVVNHRFPHSV